MDAAAVTAPIYWTPRGPVLRDTSQIKLGKTSLEVLTTKGQKMYEQLLLQTNKPSNKMYLFKHFNGRNYEKTRKLKRKAKINCVHFFWICVFRDLAFVLLLFYTISVIREEYIKNVFLL